MHPQDDHHVSILIITALAHEYAAATHIFGAQEAHVGGQIFQIAQVESQHGLHKVAITQTTIMGNSAAAVHVAKAKLAFPKLKYAIMTGIAGAVPSHERPERHVRLGDIVLSGPKGVLQYDMIKEEENKITVRSSPHTPAAALIESAHRLIAQEHRSKFRPWEGDIAEAVQHLGRDWKRPSGNLDILHGEDGHAIPHPKEKYRPRPKVFMGSIGSANTLLKNPRKRNLLRDNHDVYAIEMEGSGIADATWILELPGYFVVRGTCDYCDENKNDKWQKYAALIAAAYTRELIRGLPPEKSGQGQKANSHPPAPTGTSQEASFRERYPEFDIEGIIGSGSSGVVYRARDRITGEVCALKALHEDLYRETEVVSRLLREVQIMARCGSHANILKAQPRRDSQGRIIIQMPFITTGTLKDRIQKKNLDTDEILLIGEQVFDAVSFLHAQGVIHRDIKPENILIDDRNTVKITDFGIAAVDGHAVLTKIGNVTLGTEDYLAPEQREGHPATSASDVYSAALVLRAMQTGTALKAGEIPHQGMHGALKNIVRAACIREYDRPPAKNLLEVLRAVRASRTSIALSDTKLDHRDRTGLRAASEDIQALARDLRSSIESGRGHESMLARMHGNTQASEGITTLEYITKIQSAHINASWYNLLHSVSVQGIIDSCKRDRFFVPRLLENLARQGVEREDQSLRQHLKAKALPLRSWIASLSKPHTNPANELGFIRYARKVVGMDPEATPKRLDEFWVNYREIGAALQTPYYTRRCVRKRSGGKRWLHVPSPALAKIQRVIALQVQRRVPGHPAATAFLGNRSAVLHARYHSGARAAVIVDVHDFFGSITWQMACLGLFRASDYRMRLQGAFGNLFSAWSSPGLSFLRDICFVSEPTRAHEFLPQGAPTSPVIANSVASFLDQRIEHQIEQEGMLDWTYSRYADDLVISSPSGGHSFHEQAQKILLESIISSQWLPSENKIRHWSSARGGPLVLCGVVVPSSADAQCGLPREIRRRVRSALHSMQARDGKWSAAERSAAIGLVSYAYAITADLKLLAAIPSKVRDCLIELVGSLPGATQATTESFFQGWSS